MSRLTYLRLLWLVLLFCCMRTAHGADWSMPWNPKFTPKVSRAQALRLASKGLGREAQYLLCRGAGLVSMNEKYTAGEWRVAFVDKQGRLKVARRPIIKEVVVSFSKDRPDASVKVYNGVVAR
jgi:hypothetical protein